MAKTTTTASELDTKKTTKTTTAKAVEVKTEATVEKKAAEKKPAAKKTTTKKAAEVKKEEIFLQFAGLEFSDTELVEKVKANYVAETGKKVIKNVKLYVKPEEMMVYYVVNEKHLGKVSLY